MWIRWLVGFAIGLGVIGIVIATYYVVRSHSEKTADEIVTGSDPM